jgi:hypothetical protein
MADTDLFEPTAISQQRTVSDDPGLIFRGGRDQTGPRKHENTKQNQSSSWFCVFVAVV